MALSDKFENSIKEALSILSKTLSVTAPTVTDTHKVVEVKGWQDKDAVPALAMYLVGLRASVIDQTGRICSDLVGNTAECAGSIVR